MHAVKLYLDAVDPRLFYLTICAVAYLIVSVWSTYLPLSFAKLPPQLKALPSVLIGAVLSASASSALELKAVFLNTLWGAVLGLTAVGGYEAKTRLVSGLGTRAVIDVKPDPVPDTTPVAAPEQKDSPS